MNVVMNMYGGIIRAVTDDSSLFCEKVRAAIWKQVKFHKNLHTIFSEV